MKDFRTEPHVRINDDRTITVPKELRKIAVQFDHDVETVTFDCPRYWDGIDMSKMTIYVHYMRSDMARGKFLAKNVVVDETDDTIMHFDWLLSQNVTLVKGRLIFLVCIKEVGEDGKEIRHWNSERNEEMHVSEGLECDDFVMDLEPDIITDLLIRMDKILVANSPILDTTLTERGLAADAKATGDAIRVIRSELMSEVSEASNEIWNESANRKTEIAVERKRIDRIVALKDGSTTGDAELQGIRIGTTGEVYSTAGEAVREQLLREETRVDGLLYGIIDPCGRQILKMDYAINGKSIDIYTGVTVNSSEEYYCIDEFMVIVPGEQHYLLFDKDTRTYLYFYDADRNYLSNVYIDKSCELDEFPTDATYLKAVFIRNGETDYVPGRTIRLLEGANRIQSKLIVSDGAISEKHCSFFIRDILNHDEIEYGMVFNPASGIPYATDMDRAVTGFIDIQHIQSITTNFKFFIAYYDEKYSFITDLTNNSGIESGTFVLPKHESLVYIRMVLLTSDSSIAAKYHVSNSDVPYEKDGIIKDSCLPSMITTTWYKTKKITAYGDSITEGNKWQPYVSSKLGCTIVNCGVGGTTVANNSNGKDDWMCGDNRINTIPTDSDMIILAGGANDWAQSIDVGVLGDGKLTDSTFKSAYSLMIKKIVKKFPNTRIVALTLINGRTGSPDVNEDNQFNVNGFSLYDYSVAVKEVCMYYGIPCIDIHGESGINSFNHTTYIGDIVHPNDIGGKRIANAVINGLKRFEPIDF